jgi:AraC-like DNA-binding protein
MYRIRQLFSKAKQGMEIVGATAQKVRNEMFALLKLKDFQSVLAFLTILHQLAGTADYVLLSSEGYTNSLKELDSERMNKVHAYVMKNFRKKISLDEVAAIASMTPTSFSRYFKTHANKTFSEFLTEIRIGYSCKLLIEKKLNVTQACYESGFHTLSNFNRHFKAVTNHSPQAYRKIYNETPPL